MRYEWLRAYLMSKPGTQADTKPEWNWDRYMLDGKLYAAVCYRDDGTPALVTMKLHPLEGELLRGQYEDIIPGYYMNKLHWNSVKYDGAVPDDLLRMMLDHSYEIILHSLSKKRQREIQRGEVQNYE